MMLGARQGGMTGLRRLVAAAMARDLNAFVVPGPDLARSAGLDLARAGLRLAATPRHADTLLLVGPLPAGLSEAAAIVYAQMPRPRATVALGGGDPAPLPQPDATGDISQQGLDAALADLRRQIAASAFRPEIEDFAAPPLRTRIQYTCPMHPEVVSDQPGECPKCGMALIPRETSGGEADAESALGAHAPHRTDASAGDSHASHGSHAAEHTPATVPGRYACPMHPEVVSDRPGHCPKCGMALVQEEAPAGHGGGEHASHGSDTASGAPAAVGRYVCPMHPEVVSDQPGKCPKCGMKLVPEEAPREHGGGAHGSDDLPEGIEPHFMSMVEQTRDLPPSGDGLRMDWSDVSFGPFFPGLPGGLGLRLTLDGDTVAGAEARSLAAGDLLPDGVAMPREAFADHLGSLAPLSPVAYRLLACRALERAAGAEAAAAIAAARAAAVERERIASHLGWLAAFGAQTGMTWLERRAGELQLQVREASAAEIARLAPAVQALLGRLRGTPLLRAKLSGIGPLSGDRLAASGPVARASGLAADARDGDPAYAALGFSPVAGGGGDALARLVQRGAEIGQSLDLIARAGMPVMPVLEAVGAAAGRGEAVVETPRGAARLTVVLREGMVVEAAAETPFAALRALVPQVTEQSELGDALVAVGSLDLDPWGPRP